MYNFHAGYYADTRFLAPLFPNLPQEVLTPQVSYLPQTKVTGGLCFDESYSAVSGEDDIRPSHPLMNRIGFVSPAPMLEAGGGVYSKYSVNASSGSGGPGYNEQWPAVAGDYAWYVFMIRPIISSAAAGRHTIMFTDPSGGDPLGSDVGTIGIACQTLGATTMGFRIVEGWTGTGPVFEGTLSGSFSSLSGQYGVVLEIHRPSKLCKLYISSASGALVEQTACAYTANDPPLANTPTQINYTYSGVGFFTSCSFQEIMRMEGMHPGDRPNYGQSNTLSHVYAYYPSSIGDSNFWTAVNSCNATEKWRTVRDPHYDGNVAMDYIEMVGALGNFDQLFGIDFLAASNPDAVIEGVYVAAGSPYPYKDTQRADYILMKYNGVTTANLGDGPDVQGCWKYQYYPTAPGSVPWTPAVLESTQVGVRNAILAVQRVAVIVVGVIGRNLSQPSNIADCSVTSIAPPISSQAT